MTPCWRKKDSNPRSPVGGTTLFETNAVHSGNFPSATGTGSFVTGRFDVSPVRSEHHKSAFANADGLARAATNHLPRGALADAREPRETLAAAWRPTYGNVSVYAIHLFPLIR